MSTRSIGMGLAGGGDCSGQRNVFAGRGRVGVKSWVEYGVELGENVAERGWKEATRRYPRTKGRLEDRRGAFGVR